ncbi:MAG TPA: DUF4153 domain-containing protein [Caulobacteraceae bacterium]|jgi:hypothetical protein
MTQSGDVEPSADRRRGAVRLAVGLAQGLAFYGLHRAEVTKTWPATDGPTFAACAMALVFAPVVVIGGLGHLRRTTLGVWTLVAAVIAAGLSAYAVAKATTLTAPSPRMPDFPVFMAVAALVFIAHHLIVPADARRRWLAPYRDYFDVGWLDAAQLGLALAFTGAFWLLLQLGASLFQLIGISGFRTVIQSEWFAFPATTGAFAMGVHLADVRLGLTRGLRTIGLFLLSWLLPLMTLIAAGFLISLLFTGLAPLWRSRVATGVLLASMATLIVLVNAAYRDGGEEAAPFVLRWATRITAVALVPLAILAAYGLGLRISQHGLTPERIIAGACLLVALLYALGYAFAALAPGRWMRPLERANVAAAFLILGLIVALFSPIADPTPISVRDQVARLVNGKVAVADFDFNFLRFRAGKAGLAALNTLAKDRLGPHAIVIAERARSAMNSKYPAENVAPQGTLVIYPKGTALPEGLEAAMGAWSWPCRSKPCEVFPIALTSDGSTQYLLSANYSLWVFARDPDGHWSNAGLFTQSCPGVLEALRAGRATAAPPLSSWKDLIAGGNRLTIQPTIKPNVCFATSTQSPPQPASKPPIVPTR